jgi:Fe-S-cluster containining protein
LVAAKAAGAASSDNLLPRIGQAIAQVPILEPCASCGVRCCNRFAVPITGFDIIRIIERIGGEPKDFAQLAPAENIESSPHSLIFIFEEGKLSERLLVLKRHPKTNWCCFSRHTNGCAIWGFHPLVCQAYPFILGKNQRIEYTKNFVCPRKWEKSEYLEKEVRRIIEKQNLEIEKYNKIVRAWNAEKAESANEGMFWKYLIKKSLEMMGREK